MCQHGVTGTISVAVLTEKRVLVGVAGRRERVHRVDGVAVNRVSGGGCRRQFHVQVRLSRIDFWGSEGIATITFETIETMTFETIATSKQFKQ